MKEKIEKLLRELLGDLEMVSEETKRYIKEMNNLSENIMDVLMNIFDLRRYITLRMPYKELVRKAEDIDDKLAGIGSMRLGIENKLKKIDEEGSLPVEEIHYLIGVLSKTENCIEKLTYLKYNIELGASFKTYNEKTKEIESLIKEIGKELGEVYEEDLKSF